MTTMSEKHRHEASDFFRHLHLFLDSGLVDLDETITVKADDGKFYVVASFLPSERIQDALKDTRYAGYNWPWMFNRGHGSSDSERLERLLVELMAYLHGKERTL